MKAIVYNKETFIINVESKPLPFKGWRKQYTQISRESNPNGNYTQTDTAINIIKVMEFIDKKRPDIKTIIVDDMQYIMANEYMRRAKEGGWERFNDIGQNMWNVIGMNSTLQKQLLPNIRLSMVNGPVQKNVKTKKSFLIHGR